MLKTTYATILKKIDIIFDYLTAKESDPINQSRIKMLVYTLVSSLIFSIILATSYVFGGDTLQLIRITIILGMIILLIIITYYKHAWKFVSHFVLIICTLVVWTNILIYVQNINTSTLQYIWLVCLLSFYMHGLKWGWFYSLINIIPVLLYTVIEDKSYFLIGTTPKQVNHFSYVFVISYNYSLIIFLQYYFFRTFNRNFISLTTTKNELKESNNKLKASLHEVEKLSNARMDFLSTMSHELRTPLNGVIGISNALLHQNPRKDQEENLDVLKFSAQNLLLLINNILDFNKYDSDTAKLEQTSFDFYMVIKNIHASLKLKASEKLLQFNLDIDKNLKGKHVNSDPTRLTQILSNLMNNALKFTEKGSVNLTVTTLSMTEKIIDIRFTIEDTGIGIEADRQQKVFEAYIQASPSTSRNYGGTGLGLPIVKKLLTMFNSEVNLSSIPDVGTKIYFDIKFPYKITSTRLKIKKQDNKDRLAHLKILVAEDNHINILVIKKTLAQWNIVPEIAENGEIALNKVIENKFDLILMDLYMPEMDGYESAIAIRNLEDKHKSAIPIIAVTANVNSMAIEKIKEAGMDDYLSKPFDPEMLFEKIEKLTSTHHL